MFEVATQLFIILLTTEDFDRCFRIYLLTILFANYGELVFIMQANLNSLFL